MPVVAIIGVDEAGKSTLIRELKEKYPDKIDILAFPTLPLREKLATLKIDYTDIHSILDYHVRFQLDFAAQKEKIKEYREGNKLLVLDRYIYCSLAYLRHAVLKHHSEDFWTNMVRPLLLGYYTLNIVNPNDTMWLFRTEFSDTEPRQIQDCYQEELYYYKEFCEKYIGYVFDFEVIKALEDNTFARVERALIERKFL